MATKIPPIIKPAELAPLMQQKKVVIIDARVGPQVKETYATSHLVGARFVDIETELARPKKEPAKGGRHPLPDLEQFAQLLQRLGISPESHVVVYDDKNGANAAARFWWMLRAIGHQAVQVLDGGYQAAFAAGIPTHSGEEVPATTGVYPVKEWLLPTVDIHQVEKAVKDSDFLVIDVRDAERYRGEKEPIDLIAGHIPGAVNIPFSKNLDSNGFFLKPDELKHTYEQALENRNGEQIIVHCGSGITACHTLLAMDHAGMEIPGLYVGSWGEWSRTDRPIATGAKP
jgi:thiosulfate/3-mercaptopyruvate sulfurtransferase